MMPSRLSIVGVWSFNVLGWAGGAWEWFVQNPEQRSALVALLTILSFVLAIAVSLKALLKSDHRRCDGCEGEDE